MWNLFRRVIKCTGPIPTLIEWDANIPPWHELAAEAVMADVLMGVPEMNEARRVLSADRQREFAAALLDPERPTPSGIIGPDGDVCPRRFAVYRNNVVVGLTEILKAAYPAVRRLVGEEFFDANGGDLCPRRAAAVADPSRVRRNFSCVH